MKKISLQAHFDGEQICLDEPFDLKPNTKLIVIVLLNEIPDDERQGWFRLAERGLAGTYGENEVEYPLDLIKEPNPDYEGS